MVNYRRVLLPGGFYFFTVTLKNRRSRWLVEYIDLLKEAMLETKQKKPYKTEALVVLPDHLHSIWKLPKHDTDYSGRWRNIKRGFTRKLLKRGCDIKKDKRNEYDVWQRRFWEHVISDERDFENHVNYIHYNPVKHGLVSSVKDWPHSSFHRYVKQGRLPEDWGRFEKVMLSFLNLFPNKKSPRISLRFIQATGILRTRSLYEAKRNTGMSQDKKKQMSREHVACMKRSGVQELV